MDMNKWFKSVEDKEIDKVLMWMEKFEVDTEEYRDGLKLIERLTEIKEKRTRNKIKPEIWFPAATSIASILLVLNYERLGVITSKAFGMIKR